MAYALGDLEQQLGEKVLKTRNERITEVVESLGGSAKIYLTNAVRKEISARIPLTTHKTVELRIFIEEPLTRMVIFDEGRYSEADRLAFNLPSFFVSLWLEEPIARRYIGKSVIPPSLGSVEVALSDLASSQPEVYEEARALASKVISLL